MLKPRRLPGAVIVSERVAKRFWPGQDPIGKRIKFGSLDTSSNPWMAIVGVVGEVKYRGLPDNPTADPDVYLPFADRNQPDGNRRPRHGRAFIARGAAARRDSRGRPLDSGLCGRDR